MKPLIALGAVLALAACHKTNDAPTLAETTALRPSHTQEKIKASDSPVTAGLPATGTEQKLSTQTPDGH